MSAELAAPGACPAKAGTILDRNSAVTRRRVIVSVPWTEWC